MQWTSQTHDWNEVANQISVQPGLRDPRPGVRLLWCLLLVGVAAIFGRLTWIDLVQGPAYRVLAAKPIERQIAVTARRGTILARDGQVLAQDELVNCVAVQFRWLEEPCNSQWLRQTARSRLTAVQRRQPQQVAEEEQRVLEERSRLHQQLAELCGLSPSQWQRRCTRVQNQVAAIRDAVNQSRRNRWQAARDATSGEPDTPWQRVRRVLLPTELDLPPEPITVAEEHEFHVICDHLPNHAIDSITALGHHLPAVRIVTQQRRRYPFGATAAHLVGYLGLPEAIEHGATLEQRVGRAGLEAQFEPSLQSHPGAQTEHLRRGGALISSYLSVDPVDGRDLRVTLDVQLQQATETLLADALVRNRASNQRAAQNSGAALIVLECGTGAVLAAASLPGFDPNLFEQRDHAIITSILNDPSHPLLDRTIQMQIPPGSVFKVLTALALLDHGLDITHPYECQGYLKSPHLQRCAIFTRYGIGHGSTTLHEALVQSCNCYFFQHAGHVGPEPLVRWAEQLGFGAQTGIELPFEAVGQFPSLQSVHSPNWHSADTQALAIGQGAITATPMQIAQLMAFIANGVPVSPRLELDRPSADSAIKPSPVLSSHLQAVRTALTDAVSAEHGTAFTDRRAAKVAIAGKTGTAQAGGDLPDHAWFAGYAPASAPEIAFVVVLEHGGEASATAVPVADRLVEHMLRLGYLTGAQQPQNHWQVPATSAQQTASRSTSLVRQ